MSNEESYAKLEHDLLRAHIDSDQVALVALYERAAGFVEGDEDKAGFFLTQAYVFALASGDQRAAELHKRLCAMGREEWSATGCTSIHT